MSFASIEDGILFSSRLFSVSPFHERDSGEILSDHFQTFVKDIQKEDGGTLYDLVDRAFFESKDGFGLKKIKADRQLVLVENPLEELAEKMKKGRILLFIHGIFSNIEDCFKELLWASALHGAYPGGLYGFDHPTVSASTLDNALELARMLPAGSEFDIVCHSRGGLVTRYLLEHTEVKILLNENITFRRVAFVAGACKGSPYATKEFLNAFLLAATAFGLLTSTERLIAGIVELAKFANEAPGILCLDPDLISNDQELVKEAQPDPQCMFFRANFDPVNWLYNCAEEILVDCTVFHGAGNDLVVSFWGADMSDNYPSTEPVEGQVFGDEETEQSYVHHLSFFDCDKVLENIINFLLN
jgi:pimeloyl-ACP methyl ester carboxylesterase